MRLVIVGTLATALGTPLSPAGYVGRTDAGPAIALQATPSLALSDECVEADAGDTLTVDIVVESATNLLAWEAYFAYNRDIVEIVGKDVQMLLAEQQNTTIFDFSDPVPNSSGYYRLAAANLTLGATGATGTGGLVRLTLEAKAPGVSYATIDRRDLDGDGAWDFGPTLTSIRGQHLGDPNGNAIFDGAITSGQIAVERPCLAPAPTPDPQELPDDLVPSAATPVPSTSATDGATPTPTPAPSPSPRRTSPAATAEPPPPTGGEDVPWWLIGTVASTATLALGFAFVAVRAGSRS